MGQRPTGGWLRQRDVVRLLLACGVLISTGACRESARQPTSDAAARGSLNAAAPRANHSPGSAAARTAPGKVVVAQARRAAAKRNSEVEFPDEPTSSATDLAGEQTESATRPLASSMTLPPPPVVDPQRLATAGIRRLEGTHLILLTDLPAGPEVDQLPQVFDAAVAPWCEYFRWAPEQTAAWRIQGYLMDRKERFQATALLPDDLPPFLHGFQRGRELWLYEQPSDYYRRHMLLHEGTHAFMNTLLGGCGPPWYMEGIAELLATHRWEEGRLELAHFPQRRDEVEQWGRIRMVRSEVAAGRGMSLENITAYGPTAHLRNEPYAWCWAAAAFLDGHPVFGQRFRELSDSVRESPPAFTARFWRSVESDRRELVEQWQLFVRELDYGYDLPRAAIEYAPAGVAFQGLQEVHVRADRGWQSSGLRVESGTVYRVEASGRYQVARDPKIWWCEPGGVTIRYIEGRPLGMLLAAVSDVSEPLAGITPLAQPTAIGLSGTVTFAESGTLFLRINDSPAELADNAGELVARVEREP